MTTTFLSSRGYACTLLQVSLTELAEAARELDIRPTFVINGSDHFDGEATERLATFFRQKRAADG